ncbi:MAG: hypothetical protein O2816_17335 [Planctomycetota bacterium]|nr:hypothetical protein [Planctomycetota bacterium]
MNRDAQWAVSGPTLAGTLRPLLVTPFDLLPPWIALIALFGVGRVVLSLLPAGRPGGHGLGELPATWAASHVLGLIAFAAEWEWLAVLDVAPPTWWLLVPWVVLAVVRIALLPGRVTPRTEPMPVQPTGFTWLARALILAAAMRAGWTDDLEAGVNLAAIGVLLLEGGRGLRRHPTARAVLVAVLLWTPVVVELPPLLPALDTAWPTLTLLGVGGAAWTRRADERGLALALFAAVGCALLDPRLVWVGGLATVALFLASHPAGWQRAWGPLLAALLGGVVPLALQDLAPRMGWFGLDPLTPTWVGFWGALGVGGLLLGQRSIAPLARPDRERLWAVLLVSAICAGSVLGEATWLLGLHLALPVLALAGLTGADTSGA